MERGALLINGLDFGIRAMLCTSFVERSRGLLGRPQLEESEALGLVPCASVHTFGMRYVLDVVFCDRNDTVLHIVRGVAPGRMTGALRARSTWELRAGVADRLALVPGDRLVFAGNRQAPAR
jgi:uncharacterized membrane protein (UPF0127 family)